MSKFLLGCDWGTTSIRLKLINLHDFSIKESVNGDEGIARTYLEWQQNINLNRIRFYQKKLSTYINLLSEKTGMDLTGFPLVISGMASSTIGIEQVPYSNLPFSLNGLNVITRTIPGDKNFSHQILLVSGVRSDEDVMRGEETQLIGLKAILLAEKRFINNAVLIFPGTHAKHIYIEDNCIKNFKTFMTGELFNSIVKYSILQDSVEVSEPGELSESDANAFRLGLKVAQRQEILHHLFSVRTNQLFNKLGKKENAFYLSGLLIGSETNDLLKNNNHPIWLCSGGNLFPFYKMALEESQCKVPVEYIQANWVDQSAFTGQTVLYKQQLNQPE